MAKQRTKNDETNEQLLDTGQEALGLCFGVPGSLQVAFQDPPHANHRLLLVAGGVPFSSIKRQVFETVQNNQGKKAEA